MKEIPLTGKYGRGKVALVDDEDYDKVKNYKWRLVKCVGGELYPTRTGRIKGVKFDVKIHHAVLAKPPRGLVTDHINGDTLDNRKENLRFTTPAGNSFNRKNSQSSSYNGVVSAKRVSGAKWRAIFKSTYLGVYETEEEAAQAFNEAVLKNGDRFDREFLNEIK